MKNGTWKVVFANDGGERTVEAFVWEQVNEWVHFTHYASERERLEKKGLLMLSVPVSQIMYIRLMEAGESGETEAA